MSVKRTLGGTFSVFGRRRVFRGIPAASNAPPTSLKGSPPAPGSTVSAGGSRKDGVEGEDGRVEGGGSEVGAEGADDRFRGGFGGDGCSAVVEATVVDEGAEPSDAYAAATEGKVNGDDSLADDVKAVSTFAAAAVDVTAAAEFSSAARGLSLTGAEVSVAEVLSSPDAEAPQNETPQNGKMSHDEHRPVPGSVSKSNLEPLTTNDEKDAAEGSWTAERKEMAETDGSEKDVRRCTESVGLSCGDDDDNADLNERVEHLVLVVHGIGDALMSVDLGVVQLRSLVECCDTMRNHHEEVRTFRVHRSSVDDEMAACSAFDTCFPELSGDLALLRSGEDIPKNPRHFRVCRYASQSFQHGKSEMFAVCVAVYRNVYANSGHWYT